MDHLTRLAQFTIDDARALLPQWQQALRAEAKSPGTIDTYTHGLQTYLTWCARTFEPPLARATMTTWMSDMLEAGAAPGSVRIRQLAVRRFVAWLIDTGHLPVDPFAGVKGPRQTEKPVTPLTDDDLRALIATCDTPTLAPASRSITAATRRSSGSCSRPASASERPIALQVDDVDLDGGGHRPPRQRRPRARHPHRRHHERRAPRVPVPTSPPPTRRLPGAVAADVPVAPVVGLPHALAANCCPGYRV